MKNVLYTVILVLALSACSDKKQNEPQQEGFFTVDSQLDAKGNKVYLRLESDRAIRYSVNSESNTYSWESLKYADGKLNGKLLLEDATCLSTNKANVGKVVEDLSASHFRTVKGGFLLNNIFFRKLSDKEVERLLAQFESSNHECINEVKVDVRSGILTTELKEATSILNPEGISSVKVPVISGEVLKTDKNGVLNFISYSDKAYISYNLDEKDPLNPDDDTVSWNYYELLDGHLAGRRVKLKNSCPANHPQGATVAHLVHGNYREQDIIAKSKYDLKENETDSSVVLFGETKFQKLALTDWQLNLEKIFKAKIVCK